MSGTVPGRSKKPLILGILIITVGVGWLLTAQGLVPGLDWIWTLGLGVIGVLAFVISGGVDKASVVIGPFFLIGSLLSILRQTDRLALNTEVPLLVIVIGVLVVIAQMSAIPEPKWYEPPREGESS